MNKFDICLMDNILRHITSICPIIRIVTQSKGSKMNLNYFRIPISEIKTALFMIGQTHNAEPVGKVFPKNKKIPPFKKAGHPLMTAPLLSFKAQLNLKA